MAETLARLLLIHEIENGLTQREMAERIGVADRQYARWRREGAIPQGPGLKQLSLVLDIPARELAESVLASEGAALNEALARYEREVGK